MMERGHMVTMVISLLLYTGATYEGSGAMGEEDDFIVTDSFLQIQKYVETHELVLKEISGILNKHLLSYSAKSLPDVYTDRHTDRHTQRDCADIYKVDLKQASGIYTVYPDGKTGIQVFCDMDTDGGGWTVFQRRQDGSVNFNQSWDAYKKGFGNLSGEFWLGNDNLATLTASKVYKIHIDLQDFDLKEVYAEYDDFLVLPENRGYRLVLAAFNSYNGTAGDSLWPHAGHAFSTYDRDNDLSQIQHCSRKTGAGFWFYYCQLVGLNGKYSKIPQVQHGQGIVWRDWHGSAVSLKRVEMKFRPVDYFDKNGDK